MRGKSKKKDIYLQQNSYYSHSTFTCLHNIHVNHSHQILTIRKFNYSVKIHFDIRNFMEIGLSKVIVKNQRPGSLLSAYVNS